MSEPPKLEECVEETTKGSRKSQLVLHGKTPAVITEGPSIEAASALPLASSHSSPSASPNQTSNHAPKIEGQDHRRDKEGADRELRTNRNGRQFMVEATVDTSAAVESSSGTGKTGHSTRTKRKHKTMTRKRQHGKLRLVCGNLLLVCGK
jgi:hypothetical protein